MDKIVNLSDYRHQVFKKRVYGFWEKHLSESFGLNSRFTDLSDKVLYLLAQPGDASTKLFYELIMGILDYGKADDFFYLDNHQKLIVVDIHMFLADHGRFEMMRRLGWLESHPCLQDPLVAIVQQFDQIKPLCLASLPTLASSHSDYESYQQLISREKQVFIRWMLHDALEVFKKRISTSI